MFALSIVGIVNAQLPMTQHIFIVILVFVVFVLLVSFVLCCFCKAKYNYNYDVSDESAARSKKGKDNKAFQVYPVLRTRKVTDFMFFAHVCTMYVAT